MVTSHMVRTCLGEGLMCLPVQGRGPTGFSDGDGGRGGHGGGPESVAERECCEGLEAVMMRCDGGYQMGGSG